MHAVLAANAEADQPWVVDAAIELAKQTDATIAVVSVDELAPGSLSTLPRSAYRERAAEAATRAVERLAAAGITATRTVLSGGALEEILRFAQQEQADVIVVGSSIRGPIAERLLGSVPLGLLQRADKPVLVITKPAGA